MKTITLRQVRHNWGIYVLVLPAIVFIGLFSYYPAVSAMYHAFFYWNGDDISEFVGLQNFVQAFQDKTLAYAFGIVLIFIASNFVKMVPSVITAVVIHRMTSDRSRYLYRVLFVIPMIIPGIVWLLIWKFFFNQGVFNTILRGTGGMWVLRQCDVVLPALSRLAAPILEGWVSPTFGGVFGMLVAGFMLLSAQAGFGMVKKGWLWWLLLLPFAMGTMGWQGLTVLLALITYCLIYDAMPDQTQKRLRVRAKWLGVGICVVAGLLILGTQMWTETNHLFDQGRPPWLGDSKLAVPALILWGFPWVGVVSVLLYLSGLGNIDTSVYEAADIDGCGWFRKFWNIELPLITSQIRLNLVLMIIGTLQGWGLVFILWGDDGGPGGAAMLPGLYMFRKAFTELQAGYACAIGLLLFFLILLLTLINNKYVRVEK